MNHERDGQGPEIEYESEGTAFNEEDAEMAETISIDEVLEETARQRAITPLDWEEIERLTKSDADAESVANHGWFVRVGAHVTTGANGKKTPVRGSHIKGHILSTNIVEGRFGKQQYVVVYGRNTTPRHRNRSGQVVPAVDGVVGRWIVGIDATLAELPGRIGEIVELEFSRAPALKGQRNVWKTVRCWPAP